MTTDSDISAALPEPPPPRPARRDAAIEAALQRFDGGGTPDRPRVATPASWRRRIVRPQFAAFATVALVALISLPVWMSGDHQFGSVSPEAPASAVPGGVPSPGPGGVPGPAASGSVATQAPATPSPTLAATPSPTLAATPSPTVSPKLEPPPPSPPSAAIADSGDARCAGGKCDAPADALHLDARDTANMAGYSAPQAQAVQEKRLDKDFYRARQNRAELAYAAPPPPPAEAAPPPSAFAAAAPRSPAVAGRVAEEDIAGGADIAVTGTRVSKSSSEDVVVTGRRRSAAKPIGRGDWNACTVDDPNRRLSACKKLVDPAASGPAGRAATHVADGLSLAWQDDLDGAIAAFDEAIAASPRLSFAYLNRGLAYGHKGELTRALADLDQAVRYAPNAARNYYSRSLAWRQRGDTRRAEADEARAIDLDQRYEGLFR
ncbi:MAG: tetratricopeptide repeat protein [Sphingomonas sp.]